MTRRNKRADRHGDDLFPGPGGLIEVMAASIYRWRAALQLHSMATWACRRLN